MPALPPKQGKPNLLPTPPETTIQVPEPKKRRQKCPTIATQTPEPPTEQPYRLLICRCGKTAATRNLNTTIDGDGELTLVRRCKLPIL
jgi:hypothetical protein